MNKYYSVAQLSERISETPEGFLICEGVAITRTGDLLYAPNETPVDADGKDYVTISRSIEDIHNPETIASFEGKPVTINHPDEFVTPENWKELAVGVIQNVRAGEGEDDDKLLADLLITDYEAISAIKSKSLREVSCGYEAEYIDEGNGKGRQENIIGNHVALVASGRCGSECAIFDHAPKPKELDPMSMKDKVLAALGKVFDEDTIQEDSVEEVLQAIMTRLDALEAKTGDTEGEEQGEAMDMDPDVAARLLAIEEKLNKLLGTSEDEDMEKTGDMEEEATDMEEEQDGDYKVGDKCKDAETVSRATILVPNIANTADIKIKALNAFRSTTDGKAVIDSLLAGKPYKSADKDMLFVAASELVKNGRKSQLNNARVSLDNLSIGAKVVTPDDLNKRNAEFWQKKGV